ncbi:unnamed protein product [Linum tenue]|uniref:Transmembrane protein n=2 Tax=Linum TaxID=4005 RepID=A0AAV0LG91_9ROSI|nr:unnamed protein product [Linum tenue]CAI0433373.1 unnamed protein product [Linum tenue]
MSSSSGPSPVLPLLLVGALGVVILAPAFMTAADVLLFLLLPSGSESSGLSPLVLMAIPVSLVLFMHLISWCLPIYGVCRDGRWQSEESSAFGDDGESFTLGALILILFFFVLYGLLSW